MASARARRAPSSSVEVPPRGDREAGRRTPPSARRRSFVASGRRGTRGPRDARAHARGIPANWLRGDPALGLARLPFGMARVALGENAAEVSVPFDRSDVQPELDRESGPSIATSQPTTRRTPSLFGRLERADHPVQPSQSATPSASYPSSAARSTRAFGDEPHGSKRNGSSRRARRRTRGRPTSERCRPSSAPAPPALRRRRACRAAGSPRFRETRARAP